jgi:FKBP-type peptidyl-prolyl cis-trans isomerase
VLTSTVPQSVAGLDRYPGSLLAVEFVGVLAASGAVFDRSDRTGSQQPLRLRLGAGQVTSGWGHL